MKVTVTFGDTSVVVPCKPGWTVRDLVEQATRRYHRIVEQHGGSEVRTHHLEYGEGGILDMDDLVSELVEDRDKLVAVFDSVQQQRTDTPTDNMSNGSSSSNPSPEPMHYYPHLQYQDPNAGEIEVNEASLKANTPLLVRSSSDSALAPPHEMRATPPPDHYGNAAPEQETKPVLKGSLDPQSTDERAAKMSHVTFNSLTKTVEFPGDRGPLGIHVVPYCSSLSGRTLGLHIKGIEENSRTKRENIFQEDECIVQINETPLQDKTFAQSQEVFRKAMGAPVVRAEILPLANKQRYEKRLIGQLFPGELKETLAKANSPVLLRSKADPQPEPKQDAKPNGKQESRRPVHTLPRPPEAAAVTLPPVESRPVHAALERISPTPPAKAASPSPTPSSPLPSKSPVMPSLTRGKGGKRIKIDLKKGAEGLGFTVVTRDSPNGQGPILVKNILPRGAAVKDGRLQPGDRILEVNGVDMTGRSQEELVAMLRSTRQGESVSVVVARQEDIFLPREMKGEDTNSLAMGDGREQLMYEIPLNETGSAGLGVSLKGNKSRETGEDLGIFIKSIIHGGAAYKDGRLNVNDQLIAVNGKSLLGHSNHAAMETLRRSMSSEGNARGTIQLVVLSAARQIFGSPAPGTPTFAAATPLTSNSQEPRGHDAHQRPSGPPRNPKAEPTMNGASNYENPGYGGASYPAAATNGSAGHYGNGDENSAQGFPPPPSPTTMREMNRDLPLTPLQPSGFQKPPHKTEAFYSQMISDEDNVPRNRASKSMDLLADESNMGRLDEHREPSPGGALGPTLGLWKSSSLESLQTAVSEAKRSHVQEQVPFHRPRTHMVRGRGCNQSFRNAIDRSYDGPSEDDDDVSEQSSGCETPVSSSSRQDLTADDGKKKKKNALKKKEKKSKGKKKSESVEDLEKKGKKKGFALLRFGKKKEDKSKDAGKPPKNKLEALSEEELDRIPDIRDGNDPRYMEVRPGHATPDFAFPDVEDDDSDPNYARINNFRQPPPSPQTFGRGRSPSPPLQPGPSLPQAPPESLDGLYAKVNKSRPPPALQSQHQSQADSDQFVQGVRRDYQQARAAPVYEELDAARRRVLDNDPNRMAPRGAESRPGHRYEEVDLKFSTQPRRDPYDYPTHSRPVLRDAALHPSQHQHQHQPGPGNERYYHSAPRSRQQHQAAGRQDVPPSPAAGRRGRQPQEAGGRRGDGYRQASPGRYTSPDRYGYEDDRKADPRRKNPVIGAV
ncbi:par-3 family cell polarity regulator beta a isoform X2 [Betta splendens]|uniref:Par-3 family cell polarity regulator beta a isoform X2 n=1 Tax=Betta splendens TaxID=158456 RepID=A0A6P7KS15_BETSP|nr:par-3 family cell polarity regulator beta a isoform X2 [Betta splendens]